MRRRMITCDLRFDGMTPEEPKILIEIVSGVLQSCLVVTSQEAVRSVNHLIFP